jgi:hypothetical protein
MLRGSSDVGMMIPLSLLSTFLGALDDDFALACLASSLLWLT